MKERIGQTAGKVWQTLSDGGPQNLNQLLSKIDEKSTVVHQALGWLARENQIEIQDKGRSIVISLRQ